MSIDGFWTQPQRDPKRAYRFLVYFPNMPNAATWYAKKVTKPELTIGKTEHKYLGHTFKYPTTTTWEDVTATLVDPVSPDAAQHLAAAIQGAGYIVPKTFTDVTTISKSRAVEMLGEIQIVQIDESMSPIPPPARGTNAGMIQGGNPVELWTLKNAWISKISFGELDYDSEDLSTIELTLTYDFATLQQGQQLQEPLRSLVAGLLPGNQAIFDLHGSS